MEQELQDVISSVRSDGIRELLQRIFRGETLKQFLLAPAAKKMHHAYLGGLAEHTLSVTALAGKISDHYPELDRDLMTAGALLHDIGKIREFDYTSAPFSYTDSGRLIGHLVLGSELVKDAAADIDDLPDGALDQIVHLILSHHGRHEFGSPTLPMTREAILLHHVDDMDAKMNYMEQLSGKLEGAGYQWSDFQRPLERFLLLKGRDEDDGESAQPVPGSPIPPDHESGSSGLQDEPGPDKPRQTPLF